MNYCNYFLNLNAVCECKYNMSLPKAIKVVEEGTNEKLSHLNCYIDTLSKTMVTTDVYNISILTGDEDEDHISQYNINADNTDGYSIKINKTVSELRTFGNDDVEINIVENNAVIDSAILNEIISVCGCYLLGTYDTKTFIGMTEMDILPRITKKVGRLEKKNPEECINLFAGYVTELLNMQNVKEKDM